MINDSLSISRDVPVVDLGRTLTVKLLKMGEEEGLTVAQAASLFGVTDAAIKNHVKNHRLNFDTFSVEQLKYLKLQGVLPLNTPTANFLPRETLRQLVRHIGTPAADAIYRHLWQMADEPAEYLKTQADVHDTDPISIAERLLVIAKEERVKRVEAERLQAVADKRAFSAMGTAGGLSKKLTAATVKIETLETALEVEKKANRPKYRVCGIEVMTDDVSEWGIDTCSKVTTAIVHWLAAREKPKDATARVSVGKSLWYAFRSNLKTYATNSNLNVDEWRIVVANAIRAYGKTRCVFEEI